MEPLRMEIARIVGLLPESGLEDAKRYLESLLNYDDRGVLSEEAVNAIRKAKSSKARFLTTEELWERIEQ